MCGYRGAASHVLPAHSMSTEHSPLTANHHDSDSSRSPEEPLRQSRLEETNTYRSLLPSITEVIREPLSSSHCGVASTHESDVCDLEGTTRVSEDPIPIHKESLNSVESGCVGLDTRTMGAVDKFEDSSIAPGQVNSVNQNEDFLSPIHLRDDDLLYEHPPAEVHTAINRRPRRVAFSSSVHIAESHHFNLRRATTTMIKSEDVIKSEDNVTPAPTVLSSLRILAGASWLNVFLVFIPIMFIVRFRQGNMGSETFAFAFLALLPTAKIFGLAMEDLTLRVDHHTGRVMRVIAGNTIELISGIIAIIQCQLDVLQASMTGSILINILLVLGAAFLSGGIKFSTQGFGATHAQLTMSLLMLGTNAVMVPRLLFSFSAAVTDVQDVVRISRGISLILLLCYIMFLIFQFFSHRSLFSGEEYEHERRKAIKYAPVRWRARRRQTDNESSTTESDLAMGDENWDEERIAPVLHLPLIVCVAILGCALITVLSEYLVSSLTVVAGTTISKQWVGLILIPLAGTFTRHDLMEAAKYGMKDSIPDSLALSTGSSVNLSLFIQPTLVLLAWAMNKPLTLLYDPFETVTLFLCVVLLNYSISTGISTWVSGMILITLYFLVAVSFFFYNSPGNGLELVC
ncbi:hypothetical protein C8R43DRAFT_1045363 [Mycena crocata]|nr:hypothetical protein C8R43DRAFT_1045363 [Mycena crocata]